MAVAVAPASEPAVNLRRGGRELEGRELRPTLSWGPGLAADFMLLTPESHVDVAEPCTAHVL